MRTVVSALVWVSVVVLSAGSAMAQSAEFVHVRDGHLYRGSQRIRLWGVNGNPGHLFNHEQIDNTVERMKAMGLNAIRMWSAWDSFYEPGKPMTGGWRDYTKGDNSSLDKFDYLIYRAKQAGMLIWCPELAGHWWPRPGDYGILPGGDAEDRTAWGEAVAATNKYRFRKLMFLDDRIAALHRYQATHLLNHVNKYTGVRYAEEPAIAVYELVNECGFISPPLWSAMEHYLPEKLHPYFHRKFLAKWNAWLREKYKTDDALVRAWGKLEPGESLADGTVRARPTWKDRKGYADARRDDYATFNRRLVADYYAALESDLRKLAPKGVGVNVAPITWDTCTGVGPATFYVEGGGTFNSASTYIKHFGESVKKDNPLHPWGATVRSAPRILGAPLVYRLKDKPFLVYETSEYRPSRFQAEHPGVMATYGSWQDWDGVFFFMWSGYGGWNHERGANVDYLSAPLYYGSWGLSIPTDEILTSQMRVAGLAFRNFAIKPAPKPVHVTVGKRVFNNYYDYLWNFPEHDRVLNTAVLQGLRLTLDDQWDGLLDPDAPLSPETLPKLLRMGSQIAWNWGDGLLKVDAPAVKMAIGFPKGPVSFGDGVRLSKTNREFVAFVLSSVDGKPIGESAELNLSIVSESRNTDYTWDPKKNNPMVGKAPVIVDRVACTVTLPEAAGRRCRKLDFALRVIEETDASRAVTLDAKQPVFYCELVR